MAGDGQGDPRCHPFCDGRRKGFTAGRRIQKNKKGLLLQTLVLTGGGKGDRTPDLLIANQSLSHLSYTPATQIRLHPKKIKNKSFLRLWKNFSPLAPFSSAPSAPASFAAVPFAAVLPALNSSLLFRPLLLCPFRFFLPRCRRLFFNSRHLLQQSPLIFNNCSLFLNCWPLFFNSLPFF